jgi:hypothetical protein
VICIYPIAIYLLNHANSRMFNKKNPFELWLGMWPSIEHLKVFGCRAYTHILKLLQTKLDPKSHKCFFLGYCDEKNAYHLWDYIA